MSSNTFNDPTSFSQYQNHHGPLIRLRLRLLSFFTGPFLLNCKRMVERELLIMVVQEFEDIFSIVNKYFCAWLNPLNPELNPICYLLALLAHHFLHVSRIMVQSLTLRLLMSYIYIYIYIYIYMERIFLMFLGHTQRRSTVGRTPLDE